MIEVHVQIAGRLLQGAGIIAVHTAYVVDIGTKDQTSCTLSRKMAYFQAFYGTVLKMHPDMHPKNRYFGLFANAWLTFEIRSFGWL